MNEEEKNIETIIDEIEAENDAIIEPETEDDVREAFEINKEDAPVILGAPLIRALGDPDPADPNMIQKHLDNFLAALCGETPVDTNVRTSTEYWLKRLADGLGGSTKPLYNHVVRIQRSRTAASDTTILDAYVNIVNTSSEAYTKDELMDAFTTQTDFILPLIGGNMSSFSGGVLVSTFIIKAIAYGDGETQFKLARYNLTTGVSETASFTFDEADWSVTDLLITRIN